MDTTKPCLLDQVRYRLRRKHDSIRSEHCYVDWTRGFILFYEKRHLATMDATDVDPACSSGKTARQTSGEWDQGEHHDPV